MVGIAYDITDHKQVEIALSDTKRDRSGLLW